MPVSYRHKIYILQIIKTILMTKRMIFFLMIFACLHLQAQQPLGDITFKGTFGEMVFDDFGNSCMAIADGKIFVQDEDDEDVKVFSLADKSFLTDFGAEITDSEDGIAVANNYIFVGDNFDDEIDVYELAAPHTYVMTFGDLELAGIEGITILNNKIFVSDNEDDEIDIFSATPPFAHESSFPFANAGAIVNYDGKLFITEENGNEIVVHNAASPYNRLGSFGSTEIARTGDGLAIGLGHVFVIDDNDNAVEVFSAQAPYNHVRQIDHPELDEPECITIGPNGELLVAEDDENVILYFQVNLYVEPIPTMSQWSLLIFGILILNLGVFFVNRFNLESAK